MRIDTGVYEGAEISMFYDPMIAKLVTFGPFHSCINIYMYIFYTFVRLCL